MKNTEIPIVNKKSEPTEAKAIVCDLFGIAVSEGRFAEGVAKKRASEKKPPKNKVRKSKHEAPKSKQTAKTTPTTDAVPPAPSRQTIVAPPLPGPFWRSLSQEQFDLFEAGDFTPFWDSLTPGQQDR
eukprot:scaffold5017_cov171-Amphora_coffeaeformis.AAC.30